jgi:hemerythrin
VTAGAEEAPLAPSGAFLCDGFGRSSAGKKEVLCMKFEWDQTLSVGVQEIDDQHKELIQRINDLREAVGEGRGKSEIGKTLKFLEEYVDEHFGTEERFMGLHPYAGSSGHHKAHAVFRKELAELKRKLEALQARGEVTSFLSLDIQRKLSDWFVNHIGRVDKALGAHLKGKM